MESLISPKNKKEDVRTLPVPLQYLSHIQP